jgi:hypothetical protein
MARQRKRRISISITRYPYFGPGVSKMTPGQPIPIGPILSTADSNNNAGNWTAEFTPEILNVGETQCEISRIAVRCLKLSLVLCNVYVDTQVWANGIPANSNNWNKTNKDAPLIVNPGQTLYFYFDNADTDNCPSSVTIWLSPVSEPVE